MAETKVYRSKWEGYTREMDMSDFVGEQRIAGGVGERERESARAGIEPKGRGTMAAL